MKTLLVYSSLTGNTQKIGEAMASVLSDCTLASINENIDCKAFDLIILGYWVDKGLPDEKSVALLKSMENCKVILFGTLGASPTSKHATDCMEKAGNFVTNPKRGNELLASWICQGKVDPKLLGSMEKITGERLERILEAQKHPNEDDFKNAQAFILDAIAQLN